MSWIRRSKRRRSYWTNLWWSNDRVENPIFFQKKVRPWSFKKEFRNFPFRIYLLRGENIPWSNNYKYLGVYLDSSLKRHYHINHILYITQNSLNFIKYLSDIKWGTDPKILLLLYKALRRFHLDYGSSIFSFSSEHLVKQLGRVQHKALRLTSRYMQTTPIKVILVELNKLL